MRQISKPQEPSTHLATHQEGLFKALTRGTRFEQSNKQRSK